MNIPPILFDIAVILSAIIQLAVLICFFIMVKHIRLIKNHLVGSKGYQELFYQEFEKHKSLGNNQMAKTALDSLLWHEHVKSNTPYLVLKGKYQSSYEALGFQFPNRF